MAKLLKQNAAHVPRKAVPPKKLRHPTAKSAKPTIAPTIASSFGRFVTVIGKTDKPSRALVLTRMGSTDDDHVIVPTGLLARSKASALEQLLSEHDFVGLVDAMKPEQISGALRAVAVAADLPMVLARTGLHVIQHEGKALKALVAGGRAHWLGEEPTDLRVKLVGQAARRILPRATLADFSAQLAPILRRNPRLLVVLWMAIAGYFARAFGRDPMGLAIIGPTSSGKSLAQDLVRSLLGISEPVLGLNATEAGILGHLANHPDAPVFLEDAQGERQIGPILRAIMDAGNTTLALRGNAAGGRAHRPQISSTLVLSAEVALADTARAGRQTIQPGIYARVFEMHLGQHGMFDHLCGEPDGHALALRVQALIDPLQGVLGHSVLPQLAKSWDDMVRRRSTLSEKIRDSLFKGIDAPLTPLQGRVIDGLVFAAFLAYFAHKDLLKTIQFEKVLAAFRTVFKEHVDRTTLITPPDQRECVECVRAYLTDNGDCFAPWPKNGRPPTTDIAGFRKLLDHELMFLFKPNEFRAAFAKLGPDLVLRHLRDAGHLACTGQRGLQRAVRTPWRGEGERMDFYVIRTSILDE